MLKTFLAVRIKNGCETSTLPFREIGDLPHLFDHQCFTVNQNIVIQFLARTSFQGRLKWAFKSCFPSENMARIAADDSTICKIPNAMPP
jgi:hypothetical protein